MFQPELLAPAGDLFKLKTAVRYGADAVYIAGRKFGLRSAARNFTPAEIIEGCNYAHQHGASVYVVLNGFLFDDELAQLPPFLNDLERTGVDAVIISDLGVVEVVRTHGKIPIHLSTQATTLNSSAAKFWREAGVKRIVLGREVSIEEAAFIRREANVEVELFIHGAMCMAYSGGCTISNYTAGRDSNRGGCIQSCRFKYQMSHQRGGTGEAGHYLSSKDLRAADLIDRFCRHGIDSMKIEGRMKSPLYVATAVRAYRRALDAVRAGQPLQPQFLAELETMSHRDYTSANLVQKAGADSVYRHEDDHQAHTHDMLGHILEIGPDGVLAVYLKTALTAGDPVSLLTTDGDVVALDTTRLRAITGESVTHVNPNRVVLLPAHPRAQIDLLLRKPRHAGTDRHLAPTG